ncbi:hypothetical protein LCGC14_0663210 [marine sediment metagenome]|uniref:Uncharacterized protein n=1 Tax=marine sediment metagenome TaxID=412755 RepID=A0A0F9U197_9ZZZZ
MTRSNYESVMHSAIEGAARKLALLACRVSGGGRGMSAMDCSDLATSIVEQTIEAATASVFLRLETEGAKRQRLDAVDVLRPHLCGECVELLDPEPEAPTGAIREGDETPGSTELAERSLFLGWAGRVAELDLGDRCLMGADDAPTPRGSLVWELHASVAERHPLGIAESLYNVIGALHTGDDKDAVATLEDLAYAELGAARSEKIASIVIALRSLIDPDVDKDRAAEIVDDWTLEELVQVEEWVTARLAAMGNGPVPTKPAVVAAFERELDQ